MFTLKGAIPNLGSYFLKHIFLKKTKNKDFFNNYSLIFRPVFSDLEEIRLRRRVILAVRKLVRYKYNRLANPKGRSVI